MPELNSDANFNYQLNRVIMWDNGDAAEVMAVSHKIKIKKSSDWVITLEQLAEKAHAEGMTVNEIAYLRMSEFFIYDTDPKKKQRYREACGLFYAYYSDYFNQVIVQRHKVPYYGGYLHVMVTKVQGKNKGVILLHGGNDSYEFVFITFSRKVFHDKDIYQLILTSVNICDIINIY